MSSLPQEPQYPDFPFIEYEERYRRLREAMDRTGLDAILITNETNHRYFSGFHAEVFSLHSFYFLALLPRDEGRSPVFLSAKGFHVVHTSWIQDKRLWDWPTNFYATKSSPGIPAVAEVPEARANKKAWVEQHLGAHVQVFTCRSADKSAFAAPGDILIDDWEKYRHLWLAAQGVWITHVSAVDTIRQLDALGVI